MNTRIRTQALPNNCLHHDHDYHQLVIAYSGCADFEVNGRGGRVDPLHGCLVPGGDVHFYEGVGDNSHIIMDLPFESVDGGLGKLFETGRYFEVDGRLRGLLSYMHQEAGESGVWWYYPGAAEGIATVFLSSLHQRIFSQTQRLTSGREKVDLGLIDDYIEQHMDRAISIADLAGICNVSSAHFHQLFRQLSGKTPGQYLLEARLSKARELIMETSLPLIEVAERVGFSSQSAMTHAFRRVFSCTPGQLRRGR